MQRCVRRKREVKEQEREDDKMKVRKVKRG